MPIAFTMEGEPCPWTSWPKRGPMPLGFIRMQAWQEQIRAEFLNKYPARTPTDRPRLRGLISLEMEFYRGIPLGAPKGPDALQRWIEKHIGHKPDLTNYQKAAEDALKGVAFGDDSSVVKVLALKWYSRVDHPLYPGGYSVFKITEIAHTGG